MDFSVATRLVKRVLPQEMIYRARISVDLISPRRFLFKLPRRLFSTYQYPSTLILTLTNRCNLRCFICRREGLQGEDLRFENLFRLKHAIQYARVICFAGFGEPLLHPRFEEVLQYIYSVNPRKQLIQVITNGTRLSVQTARWLQGRIRSVVISLNAAKMDTYNRDMKNGDFQETLRAIRAFLDALEARDRSRVVLHFVAHRNNFRELPDFVLLAQELGVSGVSIGHYLVGAAPHQAYSLFHVQEEFTAVSEEAARLGSRLGIAVDLRRHFFRERRRSIQGCLSPLKECMVDVNGDLYPCCFAGSHTMGNVFASGFEDVWFSKAYEKLREQKSLPACQACGSFLPLDDYRTHFTSKFKETMEFRRIKEGG